MKDFLSPDISLEQQFELLREHLLYAKQNSPFYKRFLDKNKINVSGIETYRDFQQIPITSKEDLQRHNLDFLAVDYSEIIDHVTTSGTLGNPVNFMLNEADLQRLAYNEYESFKIAGIVKNDVVQITTTLDRRFMAGMAYYLGLRKLGAGIIRTGSGLPGLQWDSIERFKPKFLVAVPSFLLKLIDYAEKNGIDYKNSSVKGVICIGESLLNEHLEASALRIKIQRLWDVELYSTYASTEMATAFTECELHKGNHILPNLIYTEILDEAGKPVKNGEVGELVVTPLQVESMPLIRYATGDMLMNIGDDCACGRKSKRIGPVIGRKKQMLKIKGTSLYPQHIQEGMNALEISDYFIEAKKDIFGNDQVCIKVSEEFSMKPTEIQELLREKLQIKLEIHRISASELLRKKFPKESRKPMIFHDLRSI
ncbi:phenylacetate--CoA ligase family protein [Zunongwangia endophytica]|uniref:Phenylacetate--CoA ligase family protein n=1 Tax=Zunongwangia endophytica TaxID=1808945 RepID=A0ABV8HFH5_9FLAO|nr:AMP-binding protein [Zunongwangia endophytica]MDN3593982.1 AMP-binding protein [Zunongwangia endophytica]